jgi:hypothetical protein
MPMLAIATAGGSAGGTTTAFALALTWPGPALLAECAPEGGQLLRGYFQCAEPPDRGIWNLAVAAVRGSENASAIVQDQFVPLSETENRFLLPGLADPFLATQIAADTWTVITQVLNELPYVVLADVGPIGPATPFRLLGAADLVLLVIRPVLSQLAAARPRLTRLRQSLGERARLALCCVGSGSYSAEEIRAQLGDFLFTFHLPNAPRPARILSEGGGSPRARGRIGTSALLQATARMADSIDEHIFDRAASQALTRLGGSG